MIPYFDKIIVDFLMIFLSESLEKSGILNISL
jgi:hypothetical protein